MVVVDVDDRDPLHAAVAQGLGGRGGVVDEAVAAVEVAGGVVAGRPAQREPVRVPVQQQVGAGEGDVGGGEHRLGGARHDGRAGVERVEGQAPVDGLGLALGEATGGPGQAQGVGGGAVLGHPLAPRLAQEGEEALVVHLCQRLEPVLGRCDDRPEVGRLDRGEHPLGPLGPLVGGRHGAVDQLGAGVVAVVAQAVDGVHPRRCSRRRRYGPRG